MTDLRTLVRESMNNAKANGYLDEMLANSDEQNTIDLMDQDADVEAIGLEVGEVLPHVKEWLDEQRKGAG